MNTLKPKKRGRPKKTQEELASTIVQKELLDVMNELEDHIALYYPKPDNNVISDLLREHYDLILWKIEIIMARYGKTPKQQR